MRRCVAINNKGDVEAAFGTIKEAASFYGLLIDRVHKAITRKKIVNNLKWMYEEDYDAAIKRGLKKQIAWEDENVKKKRKPMSRETKEKIAKTVKLRKEYRRRYFANVFRNFAKYHIQWMRELKDKLLESGDFGIRPELIADYYEDLRDKEVAMLASIFIDTGEECYEMVQRYRSIIGEHPWEWFKTRGFSSDDSLSEKEQRIIPFFDEWWQECFKHGAYESIGDCVKKICERDYMAYDEMILKTSETMWWNVEPFRVALFLLVFSDADGLGQDLWHIDRMSVKIPVTGDLYAFMKTWMPDASKIGNPDECVKFFDMDSIDFYYCFLAYEDFKKAHPKECGKYVSFYSEAYAKGTRYFPSEWERALKKINFPSENEL